MFILLFYQEVLDTQGCAKNCSVLSDASQEQQIVIARNEVEICSITRICGQSIVLSHNDVTSKQIYCSNAKNHGR